VELPTGQRLSSVTSPRSLESTFHGWGQRCRGVRSSRISEMTLLVYSAAMAFVAMRAVEVAAGGEFVEPLKDGER
jgi:hypothetical protein